MSSRQCRIWSFPIPVLQRTAQKCTNMVFLVFVNSGLNCVMHFFIPSNPIWVQTNFYLNNTKPCHHQPRDICVHHSQCYINYSGAPEKSPGQAELNTHIAKKRKPTDWFSCGYHGLRQSLRVHKHDSNGNVMSCPTRSLAPANELKETCSLGLYM